jgi:hypothetical protein
MAEGGAAAAVAIAEGAFVRARYQAQPTQSMSGSRESRPWALRHVMPSPETVSRRLKTASEAAISGLPFTVSYICVVVYLDDILIFLATLEEYRKHVKEVLTLLKK